MKEQSVRLKAGEPELSRKRQFWYNHLVSARWQGTDDYPMRSAMNAELRRRSDEVLNRLTRLRDSL
jgi:hypothetical protein